MSHPAELSLSGAFSGRDAALWTGAAVLIVAAHVAFAYVLRNGGPLIPLPEASEQSMVVELAPLPISTPPTVQAEILQAEVPESVQPVEELLEAESVEPDAVTAEEPETAEQVEPEAVGAEVLSEPAPEPDIILPELIEPLASLTAEEIEEIIEPEVALPAEAVVPESPVVETPKPVKKAEVAKKKPEKKKSIQKPEPEKPVKRKVAKTKAANPPAKAASAKTSTSKAPTVNPARWNSSVRAAVASRVGRIQGMRGTVTVRFVVSNSGAVGSVQVSGSSGNGKLDSAAMRAVRSARVPAPPAGLKGSSHSFVIPLTFK